MLTFLLGALAYAILATFFPQIAVYANGWLRSAYASLKAHTGPRRDVE